MPSSHLGALFWWIKTYVYIFISQRRWLKEFRRGCQHYNHQGKNRGLLLYVCGQVFLVGEFLFNRPQSFHCIMFETLYTTFVDNGNMPINEYMPKRNKKWGSHGWPQKNVPLMNDIRFDRKCYVIPPFIWDDDSWTERSYSKLMHSILKRRLDIENKRKGYNKFERGKTVFWRTFQLRFSQCSSSFFIFLFSVGRDEIKIDNLFDPFVGNMSCVNHSAGCNCRQRNRVAFTYDRCL